LTSFTHRCAVVGRGRLGTALAAALRDAAVVVDGPLGRGANGDGAGVVLLCVPDGAIADAASCLTGEPLVGHCSGATGLRVLAPHEAFSLHPLMTFTPGAAVSFAGVPAAVDGATPRARAVAEELAEALGMAPFAVPEADRTAYHAAASIVSNYLVTLGWAAERVSGLDRERFGPLVRATVENWLAEGPHAALTGPIARGDEATVTRQRAAVVERAPDLTALFDALAAATRTLAGREAVALP
jgi:predicted short-subunit dehydrogenase-like oxidoreductase (DUF2520 family)